MADKKVSNKTDGSSSRSDLLVKNIIASIFVKGWSAIVVLLMVPLTLKMLGNYSNGVWLTISGILIWIDFMDIGLGNGLRNAVAKLVATGCTGKVREAVSSTLFMQVLIVVPMLVLLCASIRLLDMYAVLGVGQEYVKDLNIVLTAAVVLACLSFILKTVGNLYMGLQLPAVSNLIICLGQTLALILTFAAYKLGSRSLLVVVLINTLSPLIVWLISLAYTFLFRFPQYRPAFRLVNLQMSRELCLSGIRFFVLQIFAVIMFAAINVVISRIFSPAEVTTYQVAYRYFSIVLVFFSIISMPFWNAATDAYAKSDTAWIRQTSRKLDWVLGFALLLMIGMVCVSDFVYKIWVGSKVVIPTELSASMAAYIFVLIASLRYSYILNGVNALRIQLIFTSIATVAFLPLAWFAGKTFGTVTSIVLAMCLVNVPGLVANRWKYYQIFYKKKE